MTTEAADDARLPDVLEALRRELGRLRERVAALEAAVGAKPRTAELAPAPKTDAEGLSEELVLVISAAIAAFLGKKPHIRQIRLVGATTWAQQGRVTIQASHTPPVHHR